MKNLHKFIAFGLLTTIFLTGCTSATFGNISLISGAKDAKESTIGKNTRMVYMADRTLSEVCNEQGKLITDAGYSSSEDLRDETTYLTGTYSDGTATLTLMCSEQEENAGIKVTMTLQNGA